MIERVFLIVLDSLGIGELPDAKKYGDEGSNTLRSISASKYFYAPNLSKLGLFNIEGVEGNKASKVTGNYARLAEKSAGKDTTIGHWEIAGVVSSNPMPTYPNGFPDDIIDKLKRKTGKGVLCNLPYSGTKVILDYGKQHIKTGDLIVYTSADSVLQIATHEDIISVDKLYDYCKIARNIMKGKHGVGRIIARPFIGEYPNFNRTTNRHDFSIKPPTETMLDILKNNGLKTIGIGKIYDIFAGQGITDNIKIASNCDGMEKAIKLLDKNFKGLCFVNLVDFDMLFGHRNDIDGYAKAVTQFDKQLKVFIDNMKPNDVVILTADHGCDPATESTDHSREYVFMLAYGDSLKQGVNLKTRDSFADISATILDMFDLKNSLSGKSFYNEVKNV